MQVRQFSALFLVSLMMLAGCLGTTEPAPDTEEPQASVYSLKTTWLVSPSEIVMGEEAVFSLGIQQEGEAVVGQKVYAI